MRRARPDWLAVCELLQFLRFDKSGRPPEAIGAADGTSRKLPDFTFNKIRATEARIAGA